MERYSEKMYIAFVLGYDLLKSEFDKLELACDEAFEFSLEIADWFLDSEYDNPNKGLYECLQEFVECSCNTRSNRYVGQKSPNSNMWWLYDDETDEWVEIPSSLSRVARSLEYYTHDGYIVMQFLERVAGDEPAWLYDLNNRISAEFDV